MTTHREHRNVNGSVRRHEHTCMKCRQRIRPWSNRWSIGRGLFVHPGCLIRASTNTITAREIALRALKVALKRLAEVPGRYLVGDPTTRLALMWYPRRRLARPPGGVRIWRLGLWWSR